MPSWKKVIVSGSDAVLNSLNVATNVTASSFTGSFVGLLSGTASFAQTASSADNFTVRGTLTAQTINVQTISSSITYNSGSNRFGSLSSNTQTFTGSVGITGSLSVSSGVINQLTASYAVTASYWSGSIGLANTASYAFTASYWSGSVGLATTASYALTASYVGNAFIQGGSSFGASASLGTKDNQSLYLIANSQPAIFISSSINYIGVFRSSPYFYSESRALEVDGTIRALTYGTNSSGSFQTFGNDSTTNVLYTARTDGTSPGTLKFNGWGDYAFSNTLFIGYTPTAAAYGSGNLYVSNKISIAKTGSNAVLDVLGNIISTGSISATSGFTGSLAGTASYAITASYIARIDNAATASYVVTALTASYVVTALTASYVSQSVSASYAAQSLTSSYALTASYIAIAQTASYVANAQTASYVQTAQTASYILNAVSASYAVFAANANTASYILNAVSASYASSSQTANTASYVLLAVSASYASASQNAATASYILNAVSASYASSSQNATTASYVLSAVSASYASASQNAQTASYVLQAVSASYASSSQNAQTSSYVLLAVSASYASSSQNAVTASYVLLSISASYASSSQNAQTASYVLTAQTASYVLNAQTASYIVTAQTASYVLQAVSSSFATTASYATNAANAFIQGGNSFGTAATLGTNDLNNLLLEVNNSTRLFISGSGNYIGAYRTNRFGNYEPTINTFEVDGIIRALPQSGASGSFETYGNNNTPVLYTSRTDNTVPGVLTFNGWGDYAFNNSLLIGYTPQSSGYGTGNLYVSNRIGIAKSSSNATLDVNGNVIVTGSLVVTLGITGSLFGSASYAITSSYWSGSIGLATTASYAITSSYAVTSSYAATAVPVSIGQNSITQGVSSYLNFSGSGVTTTISNGTASIYIPSNSGSVSTGSSFAALTQAAAANTWSFDHNLGFKYPVITVYDANSNVIIPAQITASTVNHLDIYFSSPRTGYATAVVGSGTPVPSTTIVVTSVGANTILSTPTASYNGVIYNYVATSASNARGGTIMAIWNTSSIVFDEVATTDIGLTSGVSFTASLSVVNTVLTANTLSSNWTIKVISTYL
jgi:hypothetical protein